MTYVKNALLGVLSTSMVLSMAFTPVASAQTTADMQAQIAALLAQVQALTAQLNAGTASNVTFSRNLTVGSTGADVLALQQFLNKNGCPVALTGAGAVGLESTYFGAKTKAAVACWQAAHNISPAVGYFGPTTRGAVNAMVVVTPPVVVPPVVTPPTSTPGLSGGAGSVDDYSLASGLNNEKVGEDEKDVKVVGLETEVSDGSDLQFSAVRLQFNEGGAGTTGDFEDYADEVSVWLGSNEVARVNADEFTNDNDWTKTISLDSDAVIKAGKTGTLYVAVSGAKNIDSADLGDSWTVDITSVRFKDAQGATVSEDPSVSPTSFTFQSFASASNTEFKITKGLDSVNKAHVINVDNSDDTNDVSILSFNVAIEGDSDVNLDTLVVTTSVTGATNVDDAISGLSLWMDGEEVGSASISSDCLDDADCSAVGAQESYQFDNLNLDLKAGSDYDFVVKADVYGLTGSGDLDAGDTIAAAITEVETDNTKFSAEDESGEDLADADITGAVTGEASEVRDIGINVALVSTDATKTFSGDTSISSSHDQGTFKITFDVTAFDGDVYVDKSQPILSGGVTSTDLNATGSPTILSSSITSPSGATEGTNGFLVKEGDTERFTITAVMQPTADALVDMSLADLLYALSDANGDLHYTFNLDKFKTGQVFLNFDEV